MRHRRPAETSAPRVRGADRLGALQDELLQHVLSFLPSRDAVRTSVLARRWRHQWKSVPALRITGVDAFRSARHLNGFVNHLLVLRNRTSLHACEIEAYEMYQDDSERSHDDKADREERDRYIHLWIRYALSCNARLLRLSDHDQDNIDPRIDNVENLLFDTPIASPDLTTLDLDGVAFLSNRSLVDFSSCPNLETLKMNRCSFPEKWMDDYPPVNISSKSLLYLSLTECDFGCQKRALISFPSLIFLELAGGYGLVPTFETMPSLLTASIKLDYFSDSNDKDASFLLELLSASTKITNLEVKTPEIQAFAFRKKLKHCATFSKLRILSLNDWCVEPDFGPLLYFLQLSPSLEELHLRLSKPYQSSQETHERYDSTEPFLASKNLTVVKINYREKDKRGRKIRKVLRSYGVSSDKINIKKRIRSSLGIYIDSDESVHSS